MTNGSKGAEPCCPRFDPSLWDRKTVSLSERYFIKETIPQFLHRPLPGSMGKAVARMWKTAKESGAETKGNDFLLLSYDPSPWKSELYMTVTKDLEGAENARLPGTYLSRVFDGPYSSPPKWIKEMNEYVSSEGHKAKKYFFYFTTCPRCAKIYGHNYAIVLAQV